MTNFIWNTLSTSAQDFLLSIPNAIGWTVVGILGCVCLLILARFVQYGIAYYKDSKEE